MKKSFSIFILAIVTIIALTGCPKGPDTQVDVPAVDTVAVDSTVVDTISE